MRYLLRFGLTLGLMLVTAGLAGVGAMLAGLGYDGGAPWAIPATLAVGAWIGAKTAAALLERELRTRPQHPVDGIPK